MLTYRTKGATRPVAEGVTAPRHGMLAAVLKSDGPEVPTCVYNELTASRLGALIELPAALGVLATGDGTTRYASLVASTSAARLPVGTRRLASRIAARYPFEAAGLLVFDSFIGNWDRPGNIKMALGTKNWFFCAYDHSHALLAAAATPDASIEQLRAGSLPGRPHLFAGAAKPADARVWVDRLQTLPDALLRRACCPGGPVNEVDESLQHRLADALLARRDQLADIVARAFILPDAAS